MRILILTNSSGGLYRFRREILEAFLRENEVIAAFPDDEYEADIRALGVEVVKTPLERHGMNPVREMGLLWLYRKLLEEKRPDIVFTYTIKPNIYGGIACRAAKVPYVPNITGLGVAIENGGWRSRFMLTLYKAGISGAKTVFFQNETNRALFEKLGLLNSPAEVLPGSGVNLEDNPFEPYPEEGAMPPTFNIIGRLMQDKGTDEVLYAAEVLKKKHPEIRFRLLGFYDGDYEEKVKAASEAGLVEFLGIQRDVHSYIRDSHATIHASYHEGMSNVLLETAAAGRPVIATDIHGCIETFDPGVSGIPFRAKDGDDLVRAVEEFLALPYEKKAAMGRAGREKMERQFDRKAVAGKYLALIPKNI